MRNLACVVRCVYARADEFELQAKGMHARDMCAGRLFCFFFVCRASFSLSAGVFFVAGILTLSQSFVNHVILNSYIFILIFSLQLFRTSYKYHRMFQESCNKHQITLIRIWHKLRLDSHSLNPL